MSALDNLGTQFDPVSYSGYAQSSAAFGHTNTAGRPQQNNAEEANQHGSFAAVNEAGGATSSDTTAAAQGGSMKPSSWSAFHPTSRVLGVNGNTGAMN